MKIIKAQKYFSIFSYYTISFICAITIVQLVRYKASVKPWLLFTGLVSLLYIVAMFLPTLFHNESVMLERLITNFTLIPVGCGFVSLQEKVMQKEE